MAHELPVVCLDPGGSGVTLDPSCDVVVSTRERSRTLVEQDLAIASRRTINNPSRLATLKYGALSRANAFIHQQRAHEMVERFYKST
jgi:hypothetical protein